MISLGDARRVRSTTQPQKKPQSGGQKHNWRPPLRFPTWHGVYRNDLIAVASSSFTSKTVYNFVICSRSWTFLVKFNSLSSPP
jgi:hypothetical protein